MARRRKPPRDRRPAPTLWETLITFSTVAERAVDLQMDADAVIHACAQPGETAPAVAREAFRLASEYNRLVGWILDSAELDELSTLRAGLVSQLRYHLIMVHNSVRLAFPKGRMVNAEQHRLRMTGLGAQAAALRATHDHINALLASLDSE
jgi:hypothetical protein